MFEHQSPPKTQPLAWSGAGVEWKHGLSAVLRLREEDRTCELHSDWYHPATVPKILSGTELAAEPSDLEAELQVKVREPRFTFIMINTFIYSDSTEVILSFILIHEKSYFNIYTKILGVIHLFLFNYYDKV